MTISTINQYQAGSTASTSIQASNTTLQATENTAATTTDTSSSDPFAITDVYESSADATTTSKYKTYSNIVSTASTTASTTASASSSAVSAAASQITSGSSSNSISLDSLSSSSSSDSEEDEEVELIYEANGRIIEKTTTTDEDGNETVTKKVISEGNTDSVASEKGKDKEDTQETEAITE